MGERNSYLMNMTIHFALPRLAANLLCVAPAGVARPIEMIRFKAVQGKAALIAPVSPLPMATAPQRPTDPSGLWWVGM